MSDAAELMYQILAGETTGALSKQNFINFSKNQSHDYENVAFYDRVVEFSYMHDFWSSKLPAAAATSMVPSMPRTTFNGVKSLTIIKRFKIVKQEVDSTTSQLPSTSILKKLTKTVLPLLAGRNGSGRNNEMGKHQQYEPQLELHDSFKSSAIERPSNFSSSTAPISDLPQSLVTAKIIGSSSEFTIIDKSERLRLAKFEGHNAESAKVAAFSIPFRHLRSEAAFHKFARNSCFAIIDEFISPGMAKHEINISGETRRGILKAVSGTDRYYSPLVFRQALIECLENISRNSMPRFVKTMTVL